MHLLESGGNSNLSMCEHTRSEQPQKRVIFEVRKGAKNLTSSVLGYVEKTHTHIPHSAALRS